MTYHCGIGAGMGALARDPSVSCDAPGCDVKIVLQTNIAPAWLLSGKAPRGWSRTPPDAGRPKALHYCPEHRAPK